MRWDAYNATVPAIAEDILEAFGEDFHGIVDRIDVGPGLNSYARSNTLRDVMGTTIARVLSGGINPLPHVKAQGVYSPDVARMIRTRWPAHTVSRADSAIDIDEPGGFEVLSERFQTFAKGRGIKWDQRGDWRSEDLRDPLSGRTFYLGSRQSLAMLRVYEKGKHVLQECRDEDEPPSLDWVRCEIEVKPENREQKTRLAHLTPEAAWGVSVWTRAACRVITGTAVERVIMWQPTESEPVRAVRHMAGQYRDSIQKVMADKGGPDEFMKFIEEVWDTQDRVRDRVRNRAA